MSVDAAFAVLRAHIEPILVLLGIVLTAAVTFYVARRATYLTTVTVERSKWIDKLRTNVAQLIAQAHALDTQLYRDENFQGSNGMADTGCRLLTPVQVHA